MDIFIIISLALLLIAFRFFKLGEFFSPWTLTAGIWLVIMFLFQFEGDELEPISDQFYYSLLLWLPILCGSAIITYYALPDVEDEGKASLQELDLNNGIYKFLLLFSIVTTPVLLYQIMKIVTQFDTTDLLYNIRIYAIFSDQSFGFLNYSSIINKSLLIVALWKYPKIPLWQLILIYILNLLSCFAIMEKGALFLMVTSTLFVLYEKKVIKARSFAIVGIVVVLLFFVMNGAREEQSNDNNDEMTFLDFFIIYVLSPIVAFGRTTIDLTTQLGSHTLETMYLFLQRFGFNVEVNDKLQEFVWVPLPTNVYTIFQPFYQDFGYAGVAFFAFVYGVVSGWCYRAFRNGSSVGRCIYAYFVYALILQFYQENIFLSFVAFIQYCFFVYLMVQKQITIGVFKQKDRNKLSIKV